LIVSHAVFIFYSSNRPLKLPFPTGTQVSYWDPSLHESKLVTSFYLLKKNTSSQKRIQDSGLLGIVQCFSYEGRKFMLSLCKYYVLFLCHHLRIQQNTYSDPIVFLSVTLGGMELSSSLLFFEQRP